MAVSNLNFHPANWKLHYIERPFTLYKLHNVFSNESAVTELRKAVSRFTFTQKMTDMFSFSATKDLLLNRKQTSKYPIVEEFVQFMDYFRLFASRKFNVELETKFSISCSLYENKDYLLCHDDKSDDRLIAFIFYLNSSWKPEWGGSLDIFDHDDNGQPSHVVHQFYPEFNSMIFFEVGNYTHHQVSEVTTDTTPRITINGWFHSKEAFNLRPLSYSEPPIAYQKAHNKGATLLLNHFANNEFTQLKYTEVIVENLLKNGVLMLQDFLKPHIYQKIAKELNSEGISWHTKGPANRRLYKFADFKTLPPTTKALVTFFQSRYMCSYLEELTSKKLFFKKRGEQEYHSLVFAEMQFWNGGFYSLLADDDTNYKISSVDVFLFLNVCKEENSTDDELTLNQAGNIYYYEKFDTSNKCEVEPKNNSICFVLKNEEETRYISYINKHSSVKYNVLFLSFKIC